MTDLINRTEKFTVAEWLALPRNKHGDLMVSDLELHFCLMPGGADIWQQLSGDDQTRYDNFEEELRCLSFESGAVQYY